MPITKSAIKRVRQNVARAKENSRLKRALKASIKTFVAKSGGKDKKAATEALQTAQSYLDKAVKKGIIHKNKAARKKSQLAQTLKTTSSTTKKPANPKTAKKAAPGKTSPAQTSEKKVSTGKTKKPAAKKTSNK